MLPAGAALFVADAVISTVSGEEVDTVVVVLDDIVDCVVVAVDVTEEASAVVDVIVSFVTVVVASTVD